MIASRSLLLLMTVGLAAAAPAQAPPEAGREFELLVVGPGGKPVPGAEVELRTDPNPDAGQVRKGRFVRKKTYGTLVATDGEGRLAVERPRSPTRLDVFIETPGFGPYWAGWSSESHSESFPPRFTAELEAAWSVGGIIVDPEGKPVPGAVVHPSIEFKKRPGVNQQLGSGATVKSDARGRWRLDTVPVSMAEVYVNIDHAGFRPWNRPLTRREFGIEPGREPSARIVMDRGLTVTGKVADGSGRPIAGALVRTKFLNDIREARTRGDGVYTLVGCEPRTARIVVSAGGKATDMKEVPVEPGMGPVNFRMKPGGTVRVRVLDERGKPVPKARIFFQRWRGQFHYFEFDHVSQYADDKGVWVWHEAPLDEFQADICPPQGMQLQRQPLIAREEEYVFRTTGPLVISGKVVDAATKQPIQEFRVVPGGRFDANNRVFWNERGRFTATGGRYELRLDRGDFANLVRVEADGYRAAVSREIKSDEGAVAIEFALEKGHDVAAKVVTPRNLPAAGARIALGLPGSQIALKNGEIDPSMSFCPRTEADASGRFHFPAQDRAFQLVITHPSGFAHVKSGPDWELTRIIHLEPWSRAEGTYRIGKAPAANVGLEMDSFRLNEFRQDGPHIFAQHQATTGPDGRFAFDRVIPGKGRIGRRLIFMVNEGASEVTSACKVGADFAAGKTVHIDIGGTGRPVVGRLLPPEGFAGKVRWNFAYLMVAPDPPGDPGQRPDFTVTLDRDGKFRVEDVPPGGYTLNAYFMEHPAGHLRNHRFRVPAAGGDPAARPVNLGTLKLEAN